MYTFRTLKLEDLPQIYHLIQEAGLNLHSSEDHWTALKKWSFFDSPLYHSDLPAGHIMLANDEIIGFVGYSYRKLKRTNKIVPAVILSDYAIHPKHRGMAGLLLCRKSIETFDKKNLCHDIVALHHSEAAGKIWKSFGAVALPGTNRTYSALLSLTKFIVARYPLLKPCSPLFNLKILQSILCPYLRKKGKKLFLASQRGQIQIIPFEFNQANELLLDELLLRFEACYEIGLYRDRAYLNWRYRTHPFCQNYYWYSLMVKEKLRAVFILMESKNHNIYLCDFIFDPKEHSLLNDFMVALIKTSLNLGGFSFYTKIVCKSIRDVFDSLNLYVEEKSYNQFWIYPQLKVSDNILFTMGDFKED